MRTMANPVVVYNLLLHFVQNIGVQCGGHWRCVQWLL